MLNWLNFGSRIKGQNFNYFKNLPFFSKQKDQIPEVIEEPQILNDFEKPRYYSTILANQEYQNNEPETIKVTQSESIEEQNESYLHYRL